MLLLLLSGQSLTAGATVTAPGASAGWIGVGAVAPGPVTIVAPAASAVGQLGVATILAGAQTVTAPSALAFAALGVGSIVPGPITVQLVGARAGVAPPASVLAANTVAGIGATAARPGVPAVLATVTVTAPGPRIVPEPAPWSWRFVTDLTVTAPGAWAWARPGPPAVGLLFEASARLALTWVEGVGLRFVVEPSTALALASAPATTITFALENAMALNVGDDAVITGTFRTTGTNVLVDPTTLSAEVTPETSPPFVVTYPSANFTRVSLGVFQLRLDLTEAGTWTVTWRATGAAKAAEDITFTVDS